MQKTIWVLGAGKGCGNHTAEKFGKNGFRVVLMSRSAERIAAYEKEFKAKNIEVYTAVADAANPASVTETFKNLKARFGTPDVFFYNVGITGLDSELNRPVDFDLLLERYKIDVAGAYHAITQIADDGFSKKQGAILVTGGGLALNPMFEYLPLSMDKAALRAMCLALHAELKKRNIYLGTLTVTNVIAPGEKCDPAILAEDFWQLYTNRTDCEFVR